jgi:hypothetical protein
MKTIKIVLAALAALMVWSGIGMADVSTTTISENIAHTIIPQ